MTVRPLEWRGAFRSKFTEIHWPPFDPWDVILDIPIEPDDTCGDICEDPACHTPHVSQ